MTEEPAPPPSGDPLSFAEQLGRRAARFAKAARPRVERFAAEAAPRIQKTANDALQYAKEHEDEIRDSAASFAKARFGALGAAFEALANGPRHGPEHPEVAVICPSCATRNSPSANFCNHCGSALNARAPDQQL